MSGDLARALADMEEARRSHVEWAEWLEGHPDAARDPMPTEDAVDTAANNREWVRKYDNVIACLAAARTPEEGGAA